MCVYYWVQEYDAAYRSLTDPDTTRAQLRAQTIVATIASIGLPLENYARALRGLKRLGAVVPYFGRQVPPVPELPPRPQLGTPVLTIEPSVAPAPDPTPSRATPPEPA